MPFEPILIGEEADPYDVAKAGADQDIAAAATTTVMMVRALMFLSPRDDKAYQG
ncbi:MAG: hypothetical protein ACJ716_15255 [Marmoricola sp.]